jgi:hypothetical protein
MHEKKIKWKSVTCEKKVLFLIDPRELGTFLPLHLMMDTDSVSETLCTSSDILQKTTSLNMIYMCIYRVSWKPLHREDEAFNSDF